MAVTDKLAQAVSALTGGKLQYLDTGITLASGKEAKFSQLKEIRLLCEKDCVSARGMLEGYCVEISLCRDRRGSISCAATVTAQGQPADKVRRVDSFVFEMPWDGDTCVLHSAFLNEGIHRLGDLDSRFTSRYFFSAWQSAAPEDAVSLLSRLGAKFDSVLGVERKESCVQLCLSTIVPYSYEGPVQAELWHLYTNQNVTQALEDNAARYGTDAPAQTPIGWSTWDYYFTSATEDDVKEQVDFIAADPVLRQKVRYIALDDGWQQREGDWRSGCRYPSGLKALTEYIESKGFRAGVWIAPTRLHNLCGTVMRRNAFLSVDANGDPLPDEDMYMLDPTHPDGERFLRETFTYLASCGFTFYKLDFISNVLTMERFYDKNAGPYDALAKLIAIVRQTVPDGSHVMGCSLPYGMGAGYVDSRRTGLDIHNTYKHLIQCLEGYLPQFASNERIYRNDLDYLVVRGPQTTDDPMTNPINPAAGRYRAEPSERFRWRDGADFTYNEGKMWCGIVLMAGGSIFLGDKLTALNEQGLELLRRTLAEADFKAAVPVVDGSGTLPRIWKKKGWLFVFNFSDTQQHYTIDLEGTYRDVYTDEELTANGAVDITVNAHDCLCLKQTKNIRIKIPELAAP